MPPASADEVMRFGHFEVDPAQRTLRVDGEAVAVGARAFDLLLALAQRRERLVGKQELLDLVWPGVVVEEHNIATQISTLRKLLGAQVIATLPGRGYRFTAAPADIEAASSPLPTLPPSAQTHLPRELTPLLGREDDLAALAPLLARCRLVTLVGAGGVGKSLLARHLLSAHADGYAQGVCWIELASVNDASALPGHIATALGVRPGAGEPLAGLCAAMASLTMLVALDNAEHLLADIATTAAALLDAAPGLRLLVTSQAPLLLGAERVYRVGPLAVPQGVLPAALAQTFGAVALFVERARSADARFALSDDSAPAVIALCRQLDGLPLAIELAAARAPLLGVAQLAASMHDRLQLLTRNRDASAPARQQTLRAALEWSLGFLDARERTVFRRLGVMTDSSSLAFIQQVLADAQGPLDAWAVLDALGTLVDRSLVTVIVGASPDASEPRYRLLESPRLLALEQLRDAGEEDALRRRHAEALRPLFEAAWADRWSGRIGAMLWSDSLLPEANHARAAVRWACSVGEHEAAVVIAATLFTALPRWSHLERMALADLCESLADTLASPELRLRAWSVAVRPMVHRSQQQSLAVADKALALAREVDTAAPDRWPLYRALADWIIVAAFCADPAPHALREALAELLAIEDSRWPAQRLMWGLGAIRIAQSALASAASPGKDLALIRRWIAAVGAAGEDATLCTGALMDAEIACGHAEAAVAIGEAALQQLAGTRDLWTRSLVLSNLALALLTLDAPARARPYMQATWAIVLQFDLCALCADYPPLMAALEGRFRTAARLAGYADAACAARGIVRFANEAATRERAHLLARAALGDAAFNALMAQGQALRDEQVEALAFATDDSPA